jgi:hypothetical protein
MLFICMNAHITSICISRTKKSYCRDETQHVYINFDNWLNNDQVMYFSQTQKGQ